MTLASPAVKLENRVPEPILVNTWIGLVSAIPRIPNSVVISSGLAVKDSAEPDRVLITPVPSYTLAVLSSV